MKSDIFAGRRRGIGRELGFAGIEGTTEEKTVTITF
jgi:hypothetical protein